MEPERLGLERAWGHFGVRYQGQLAFDELQDCEGRGRWRRLKSGFHRIDTPTALAFQGRLE